MGMTHKMERLFTVLPLIMVVTAFLIMGVTIVGNVVQVVGYPGPFTEESLVLLLMIVPAGLINPFIMLGVAALMHHANTMKVTS